MNAKELRQAAEVAVMQWDNHDRHRLVTGDEVLLNSDGEPDEVTFARHILSTVREDDDEPADPNWQVEVTAHCGFIDYFQTFLYQCWSGGHGKTRGQFRSLCRGLGVELKEVSRVD